MIISHDIYFLKKICNKVLYFENNQVLRSEYDFSQFISEKNYEGIYNMGEEYGKHDHI